MQKTENQSPKTKRKNMKTQNFFEARCDMLLENRSKDLTKFLQVIKFINKIFYFGADSGDFLRNWDFYNGI